MSLLNLLTILIFIVALNGQCLQEAISNIQYKCGKNSVFNSSSATFPSKLVQGPQELTVSVIIQIDNMCSASYPLNLFTLKVPSQDQGEISLITYQISGPNELSVFNQDLDGTYPMYNPYNPTEPYGQNSSMELYVFVNLTSMQIRAYLGSNATLRGFSTFTRNYTGLKFDKNTRFEFCTDSFGKNIASCTVKSLATEDQFTSPLAFAYQYFGGVHSVLVGFYSLDQKSGTGLQDKAYSLGPAQLGSSTSLIPNGKAPSWITSSSEAGVEFTDSNQYILIPTFIPLSGSPATRFIFTVSFWFKIENETNSGYIFRYTRSNFTQDLFAISIDNNQKLKFQLGTYSYTGLDVPYSVWNLLTISYACYNYSSTLCSHVSFINSTSYSRSTFPNTDPSSRVFESSDLVLLGGPGSFKGKVLKLQIFNPGSERFVFPNCESPTGCLFNLGMVESTNKNCLQCSATNTNGNKFYDTCRVCSSGTYLSDYECIEEVVETTFAGATASKGTAAAAKGMTQAVSAVSSGSSAGATAAISGKVFSNIKFINISYSNELENALTTWNPNYFSLGFNTDMPDSLEKRFVNASVPYIFAKNKVNSCFLINFWEPLMMLLMLLLFFVGILILDWMVSLKKNLNKKSIVFRIITRAKVMILNFLIVQLYGMYGDVVFYAAIDFHNTKMTAGLNLLSLFSIIFLVGAMLFGFFLHLNLLRRYQNVKRYFGGNPETKQAFDNFLTDHEGIQVIFGDFKDSSLGHQSFLFILTVRDILFSIILTTLFDHPLAECILILLMNISMIFYLLIKRPFKDVVAQFQQVILELITMVVNICVLIMAAWDSRNMEAFDGRKKIGKILIIINMIFNFIIVGFMLFNLFRQGWEVYKEYKERNKGRKFRVKAPRNILSLQNTSSLEPNQRSNKNILEGDLTVTDFLRNNSETCQTLKTGFENTIRNNPKRNLFIDQSQVLETSVVIDSMKNGLDNSSMIQNPHGGLSMMSFVKPAAVGARRPKINRRRKNFDNSKESSL